MIGDPGAGQVVLTLILSALCLAEIPWNFGRVNTVSYIPFIILMGFEMQGELNTGATFLPSTGIFKVSSVYGLSYAFYNSESEQSENYNT